MRILYIGDIYAEPGIKTVEQVLPELRRQQQIDVVIAQSENVTEGRGMTPSDMRRLQIAGVECFTGGNWSLHQRTLLPFLEDTNEPVLRPANYPATTPGKGYTFISTPAGKILVISLLGQIVGRDAEKPVDNPLQIVDKILDETAHIKHIATIVNFHGDFSSEKIIIGYYLDGKVSAVIGDHWHVPTADAMVLPKGTAHITDVGMCGALHSSLGVTLASVIPRWRDSKLTKNEIEEMGTLQFNAVLIEVNIASGLAESVTPINQHLNM